MGVEFVRNTLCVLVYSFLRVRTVLYNYAGRSLLKNILTP